MHFSNWQPLCPPDSFDADIKQLCDVWQRPALIVAHAPGLKALNRRQGRGAATNTAPLTGSLQPLFGALGNPFPLELRDGGEDVKHQSPGGGVRNGTSACFAVAASETFSSRCGRRTANLCIASSRSAAGNSAKDMSSGSLAIPAPRCRSKLPHRPVRKGFFHRTGEDACTKRCIPFEKQFSFD